MIYAPVRIVLDSASNLLCQYLPLIFLSPHRPLSVTLVTAARYIFPARPRSFTPFWKTLRTLWFCSSAVSAHKHAFIHKLNPRRAIWSEMPCMNKTMQVFLSCAFTSTLVGARTSTCLQSGGKSTSYLLTIRNVLGTFVVRGLHKRVLTCLIVALEDYLVLSFTSWRQQEENFRFSVRTPVYVRLVLRGIAHASCTTIPLFPPIRSAVVLKVLQLYW